MLPEHSPYEMVMGIGAALHDLCQPLTVLQCRLELSIREGSAAAAQTAVLEGLKECKRLNAAVLTMRELVEQGIERNFKAELGQEQ